MALSIRQPWCWFILCSEPRKDYENRDWEEGYARAQLTACPAGSNFLIHAGARMTEAEFDAACEFAASAGVTVFPRFDCLRLGGLVGIAKHDGLVRASAGRWFTGPLALKLREAYPLPFRACKGRLGFFPVGQELFNPAELTEVES